MIKKLGGKYALHSKVIWSSVLCMNIFTSKGSKPNSIGYASVTISVEIHQKHMKNARVNSHKELLIN